MELPPALRQAVDEALDGIAVASIAASADRLSRRYRGEVRDGTFHVDADAAALAYLATRLPATYAAVRSALAATAERLPDWKPASLLDLGAGPGTAFWAVRDLWPSIDRAVLVEGSPAMRRRGETLSTNAGLDRLDWRSADLTRTLPSFDPADIVTIAYVLDELEPGQRDRLVDAAWAATSGICLVVEPGTSAGWQRILTARDRLIAGGGNVVVPCPHQAACPIMPPDWCHFSRRVARSRVHLRGKNAVVPFEDEKFSYVAVARAPVDPPPAARVLAPPQASSGRVTLKLCRSDGSADRRLVSRREGEAYRDARRVDWGDTFSA